MTASLIGRALAHAVHPVASWRRLPTSGRLCLLVVYTSASYVATLGVLLIA